MSLRDSNKQRGKKEGGGGGGNQFPLQLHGVQATTVRGLEIEWGVGRWGGGQRVCCCWCEMKFLASACVCYVGLFFLCVCVCVCVCVRARAYKAVDV